MHGAAELAQLVVDCGMKATFGDFANGKIRLYLGVTSQRADDDVKARDIQRAHALQDLWVGRDDLTLMQLMDVLVHALVVARCDQLLLLL